MENLNWILLDRKRRCQCFKRIDLDVVEWSKRILCDAGSARAHTHTHTHRKTLSSIKPHLPCYSHPHLKQNTVCFCCCFFPEKMHHFCLLIRPLLSSLFHSTSLSLYVFEIIYIWSTAIEHTQTNRMWTAWMQYTIAVLYTANAFSMKWILVFFSTKKNKIDSIRWGYDTNAFIPYPLPTFIWNVKCYFLLDAIISSIYPSDWQHIELCKQIV